MILTQAHIEYWRDKKAPPPSWAKKVKNHDLVSARRESTRIHSLINAHAGIKLAHLEAGNTLAVLALVRKREGKDGVYSTLMAMANKPHPFATAKRTAYAKKWLARITRQRVKNVRIT